MADSFDAVVIGSGPNGLAAAITLAREGRSVRVIEAHHTPGGGARSAELTLPGMVHDICSAVHPMAICSPFFQSLPLEKFGLEWIHPDIPLAHPFDDGTSATMHQSLAETAAGLGLDERAYLRLFEPLVRDADQLFPFLLAPPNLPRPPLWPALIRFGPRVLPSALSTARAKFRDEPARALFAGNAAHSVLPLDRPLTTGAIGIMLMLAGHLAGWPIPKGGSGRITEALVCYFESLGGTIECGRKIESIGELPEADAVFFDTTPSAMARIAGRRLPESFCQRLNRFRHGPGIFKIDYALSDPVPWKSEACRRAGTVHVGGTLDEIVAAERAPWEGRHPEKPFVLTAQPSVFDPSRAPDGKHTFWAYCHVPSESTVEMTEAIEKQIERFAPGFRKCVLERSTMNCADYERYNPNLIGGDIVGGVTDWRQLLTRPVLRLKPHTTPDPGIFLCSASTPPGGGVHGMCGFAAAMEWIGQSA